MSKKPVSLLAALALALLLNGCGSAAPPEKPPLEGAAIGGDFTLVDKAGKTVRWADFAGKYRVIYFGYTFCPDACPMDVAAMMRGFAQFEKDSPELAQQVQPIFVSIDPARDTSAVVGEFAAAFSPRLIGLTGSADQVAAAAKSFAVFYSKGTETSGGYLMDHSRVAYLMDRQGKPLAMLPVDKNDPKAVAAELGKWVR